MTQNQVTPDLEQSRLDETRAEFDELREDLNRARKAILERLSQASVPLNTAWLIRDVADELDLDPATVQKAVWRAVRQGDAELTDELDLRRAG